MHSRSLSYLGGRNDFVVRSRLQPELNLSPEKPSRLPKNGLAPPANEAAVENFFQKRVSNHRIRAGNGRLVHAPVGVSTSWIFDAVPEHGRLMARVLLLVHHVQNFPDTWSHSKVEIMAPISPSARRTAAHTKAELKFASWNRQ